MNTITSKAFALTYSQANGLFKEDIRIFMMEDIPTPPDEMIIGEEEHQDGGKHFHVAIKWRKKQTFVPTSFDITFDPREPMTDDPSPTLTYHPNVKVLKSGKDYLKWGQYCVKEDQQPIIYNRVMMIIFNSRLGGIQNPLDLDSDSD